MSDSGFVLVDARSGERQIAFDDVASVKPLNKRSHTTRKVLIGVGIAAAVAVVAAVVWAKVSERIGGY